MAKYNSFQKLFNFTKTPLPSPVKPEIRKFPRFSKFAQNLMHQIELKCVVYGHPNVSVFWSKAGKEPNPERYIWNNKGLTKKVYEPL